MLFYKLSFQDGYSPVMVELIKFHKKAMSLMIFIIFFIGFLILFLFFKKNMVLNFIEHKSLETLWTLFPVFMLLMLALPSLKLLYFIDCSKNSQTKTKMKVMGHQWYWSYEFKYKNQNFQYDSYMLQKMNSGDFRSLEVDKPLFIKLFNYYRFLVTSSDVMHSFALPSFGIKIDAIPGRLNQQFCYPLVLGTFYGQCSEICGVNHSFMPMKVEMLKSKPE